MIQGKLQIFKFRTTYNSLGMSAAVVLLEMHRKQEKAAKLSHPQTCMLWLRYSYATVLRTVALDHTTNYIQFHFHEPHVQ